MSRWKVCLGGIAGFMLFIGISYLSLRQVEELNGVTENAAPDAGYMDMSSITDESPSYVSGEGGSDKGIYEGAKVSVEEEIDLTACGVGEVVTGMVYLENAQAAARSGELKHMIDWSKVPEGRKEEAERAVQLFIQCIGDEKEIYMTMQCQVDDSLIVQFMLMDMSDGTAYGRIYDYEHAETLTFTFYDEDSGVLFIPISLL